MVEFCPLGGEYIYIGLYRFFEHFKLGWGIHFVLAQKLELLLITVKLNNLVHHVPCAPWRGRGTAVFSEQIDIVVVQGPKACQLLGLVPHFVVTLWRR